MRDRWYLAAILVLLGAALVLAQRTTADTPASAQAILSMVADSQRELSRLPAKFTRISEAEEIHAGDSLAEEYLSTRGNMSVDDVAIDGYVQQIGGRIAPFARRKLPYRFHYIPARDLINAFALPGGHVFIGAGLIERMDTDDELADVLGHELEHIDHFHCAERLQVEAALRKVPLAALLAIPIGVFQAGYSKEQELEADREGVRLAARRGYSARGAIRLFEVFDRLSRRIGHAPGSPQVELSRVAVDVLIGYFRTHPSDSERIAQIRAMIASQPALDRPEQAMKIGYIFLARQSLDAIDHGKFAEAAALASRSLQMKFDHPTALQALAEARFGTGDLAGGQAAYRLLLARDSDVAAEVASWAETFAQHLLEQRKFEPAIALLRSVLELQPNQRAFLRLLALLQAGNGDAAGASLTAGTLRRLYPGPAAEFGEQTSHEAEALLAGQRFAEAAAMARLAIALKPGDPHALRVLGDAELAQAEFVAAVAAYRQLLDDPSSDLVVLRALGDALGSAHPATAAEELQSVLSGMQAASLPQPAIETELAGLGLLAGADGGARSLQQEAERGAVPPELLARLGWWYFRARRLQEARAVLQRASTLRPGDEEIRNVLGWVDLEEGRDAHARFDAVSAAADSVLGNSPDAGNAINAWRQKKTDPALRAWQAVRQRRPQWRTAAWRNAIYPPHIDEAVEEMEAELVRRDAAARHRRIGSL
jgi:predicted Zn-dependent protease